MFFEPNKVKIAVERLGGPTKTAIAMKCSGTAVGAWIRAERVSDIDKAELLAKLSGMTLKELRPCR